MRDNVGAVPVVRFITTSLVIPLDLSTDVQPFSIFVVASVDPGLGGVALGAANATGLGHSWIAGYDGRVKDIFLAGSQTVRVLECLCVCVFVGWSLMTSDVQVVPLAWGTPIPQPDPFTIYEIVRDASGMATFYRNGQQLAGGWADGPKWLQLGGSGPFGDSPATTNVAIAEVVVFGRAVTTIERQARDCGIVQ